MQFQRIHEWTAVDIGTQVLRFPDHLQKYGATLPYFLDRGVEMGVTTSPIIDGCVFVRYFNRDFTLRTVANSELTPLRHLMQFDFAHIQHLVKIFERAGLENIFNTKL